MYQLAHISSIEVTAMSDTTPWAFLDEFRGRFFKGEWPTIPELFRISVQRFPDRPCFTVYSPERQSLNYTQALRMIQNTAQYLRSKGIAKGDRVAVSGKNSPEWAIAYLGILEADAVVVPIDYQLSSKEIANLVSASEARILFIDEEKHTELEALCTGLEETIALYESHPAYIYRIAENAGAQDQLQNAAGSDKAGEEDLAAILFTSGTTGNPKGVMLTHRNLVSDCFLAQANLHIYHTDVFYALLPIHHSYTMLAVFIESFSVGAETVFGKKMVVKQILKDLKEAHVTMFLGVPLLFNKLLNGILKGIREKGIVVYGLITAMMWLSGFIKKVFKVNPGKTLFHSVLDKASLASIRICISGGGPLAPSVFKKYNQLGIDFVQGYGLTETSPIITLNPVEHYKETSVGKILPGMEMKILSPNADGIGEIAVKGPMVMKGYYKMPEETAAVFTPDGWFKTGDLGYIDEENYVYLTGRAKNMIVTEGGKNVYPEEIENAFQLYDEIDQILVRGYVENRYSRAENIEALIYPSPDWISKLTAEAGSQAKAWDEAERKLKSFVEEVNQKLRPYQKITRVTILREPMEMTTTKKVKRFASKVE